jgi:histidinol-phosphate/aromatic aminotransferase/cobyric acid decarboxylase-like protein
VSSLKLEQSRRNDHLVDNLKFPGTSAEHALLVMDEVYFEYADTSEYPNSLTIFVQENRSTLRTFSKEMGLAGLASGYGLRIEVIDTLYKVRDQRKRPLSRAGRGCLMMWSTEKAFS